MFMIKQNTVICSLYGVSICSFVPFKCTIVKIIRKNGIMNCAVVKKNPSWREQTVVDNNSSNNNIMILNEQISLSMQRNILEMLEFFLERYIHI